MRLAWFTRWSAATLAVLAVAVPAVGFAEAWRVDHPLWQVVAKGRLDTLTIVLIALCAAAVIPIGCAAVLKDNEFLFGAATVAVSLLAVFTSLTALMPWIHFTAAAGARWFGLLLVICLIALTMVAFDWLRKSLIAASVLTVLVLGAFITRAGYNDLRLTDQQNRTDAVTAATTEAGRLALAPNADPKTLVATAKAARQSLVNVIFEVQPPNIPAAVREAAAQVYRKTPTTYDQPVNQALLDNFDELAAGQAQSTAVAVIGLKANVHAFADAVDAAAARSSGQIARLGGRLNQAIHVAQQQLDTGQWPTASHDLTVALAAYRAAVTGTDADKKTYETAMNAPEPPPAAGFGVLAAVTDGPQALWAGATKTNLRPLVPGPLGWVLLGALALAIWAGLLRKNAEQAAGPVSVIGPTGDDKLAEILRVAVLQNLAEPGAAPGSTSTNTVTDLIGAVGGPLGPIGKILDVVYKIAGRRYGYEVSIDITSGSGKSTVLVKLKSIVGEQTFASQVFERDAPELAMRAAGLWAAGKIFELSSRIPAWAVWNADTAEALSTALLEHPSIAELRAAVQNAPGSGLLLATLGQEYESQEGKRAAAIEVYARAVAAHPRYLIARYRLAAALGAMRDDRHWRARGDVDRGNVLRCVERAAKALHISVAHLITDSDAAPQQRAMFMNLSRAFLHELAVDTRLWHRLVCALRRSERDSVAPVKLIRWNDPCARFHPLVKSLRMAYAGSGEFRGKRLIAYASRPRRWWQVSYNAACGLAYQLPPSAPEGSPAAETRQEQLDAALAMLEQTLLKPGVEQLSADWVRQDVDFQSLHAEPRYHRFLSQLRAGG